MKSISDILNSMVQPTEQKPLSGGNQSSNQGSNSSVGSFGDVLNRLAAQNQAATNAAANSNPATNSNTQNNGSASFSDTQVTVTEVQVSETVQAGNLNQTTLTNMENAVASLAMGLAKLVNLASQTQNLNPTQAQNLIVSASGGAVSASQAQQLVAQIANLKNQNSGQSALNLTPEQQGALLLQMMQSMVQNEQVTLQPSNDQNALSNGSQGTSLQFNFAGNQNGQAGSAQVEGLSIDIQTLNIQAVTNQPAQGLPANAGSPANFTNEITQKLTQLLQQLNVTPSSTPVNIQVQSSVASTNSPELAQNFQNLVQILTQAGAGQVVLNTFLTQGKNNEANHNSPQTLTPLPQTENIFAFQSVSVTAVSGTESANPALISNNNQSNMAAGQAQLLNDTLDSQNIQLTTQTPSSSPNSGTPQNTGISSSPNSGTSPTGTQQPTVQGLINAGQGAPVPTTNQLQPTTPIATNAAQNTPIQPTNNQPLAIPVVTNLGQNASVTTNTNQPSPSPNPGISSPLATQQNTGILSSPNSGTLPAGTQQTTTPIVTNVALNTPAQTINNQTQTAIPVVTNTGQNAPVTTSANQPAPSPSSGILPAGTQQLTTTIVTSVAQNAPVQPTNNQPQPTTPIVPNGTQNTSVQPTANQPATPAVNIQPAQTPATITAEQNTQNQSGANPNSQTTLSQPEDVFSNGHLEALNGIVARFNNAVVSGQTGTTNAINNANNINQFPTETQAQNQTALVQATTPVQPTAPVQAAVLVTPTVNPDSATNVVLNNQNTQQANNLTGNNVQNQLVQPTSPITQQVTNTINTSAQNSFAQAAANPVLAGATNLANPATGTAVVNANNNPAPTANPPAPAAPVQQVVTANQQTITVSGNSTAPVAASSPVVTQPVITPASVTAQNLPAASVVGEAAKTAVPTQTQANTNNPANVPAVTSASAVPAVQPVTAAGVTQVSNTAEISTNLNLSGNPAKEAPSDTAALQNLASAINASATPAVNGTTNSFQTTVNTVMNNNPNGSIDSAQIMNQITQQVASQTADAKMVSRLNFQLVPESLGRVNVQVSLVDQSISARITVTNPDVREVLQQHMVDLKSALSQAGLQIDQMQVNVQGGGANLLSQYYQYQQEGSAYRESAWVAQNTLEQPQTADNAGGFVPTGSNTLLNLLV